MEFIAVGALGALGVCGFLGYGLYAVHNRLMALDERTNSAFADTDALLKHRHTLIPGLIETVKGAVGTERDMLNSILEAQIEAIKASNLQARMDAEVQLGNSLNNFMSVAEKLPELRASNHFQHFREQLIDVENRITASRRFYNLTVAELNSTIRQFPGSIISRKVGLGVRKPFDLGVERVLLDEAVEVKF